MCWLGIWTLEVNVKPVIASHDCVTEFATKLALRSVTSMTVARVLATSTRASSALRCVLIVEGASTLGCVLTGEGGIMSSILISSWSICSCYVCEDFIFCYGCLKIESLLMYKKNVVH